MRKRKPRPEYLAWRSMIRRCHVPRDKAYKWYGERGIFVCDRWRDSFANFLEDMGNRPDGMTLDRIDNDGGYYPSNCRWTTRRRQARNRRNNVLVEVNGTSVCVSEAAELTGVTEKSIRMRLRKGNAGASLFAPSRSRFRKQLTHNGKTQSISKWSRDTGISHNAILRRLSRGWSIYQALTIPMSGGGVRDSTSGRFNRVRAATV